MKKPGAEQTMARNSLRWFQALYEGLQLHLKEEVTVLYGTERLGFFQVLPFFFFKKKKDT